MAYPTDKPSGNYKLRDSNFAELDSSKIPMDNNLWKTGYKNAEESEIDSVPDAHEQNWLFDVLHRNLKYTQDTAEENKRLLETKVATPTDIGQVKIGYGLEISAGGVLSVTKSVASEAYILSYDLPIGSYMLWAGENVPNFFIEPSGQTLLRSSYPELWEFAQSNGLVGKLFGSGNGTTTFTVTDIRGNFISIANSNENVGKFTEAGLPNITGNLNMGNNYDLGSGDGAFRVSESGNYSGAANGKGYRKSSFDASRSNSIYGKSNTVTPANWGLKIILKALPTPPANAVPTGAILDYTGKDIPEGYVVANGGTLSRVTHSRLFQWAVANNLIIDQSQIPTTPHAYYGSGDGSTTFTIPDLRDNTIKCCAYSSENVGQYKASKMTKEVILPDYSKTVGISSGYVATTSGWIRWFPREGDGGSCALYVNDKEISASSHYKYRNNRDYQFIVKKGDKITFSSNSSAHFTPCATNNTALYDSAPTVAVRYLLKY